MPANPAKLDLLMRAARNTGRLVYEHRQGDFLQVGRPGPWGVSLNGYCVAMAIEWCRLRTVNDDFDYDRAARVLRSPPLDILSLHARVVNLDVSSVLHEKGLKAGTARQAMPYHWTALHGVFQALDEAGLFIVTFARHRRDTSDPKHVIAFQIDPGGAAQRLFDPNFGHIAFDNPAGFAGFMEKFLGWGYGAPMEYSRAYVLPVASRLWQGVRASSVSALRQRFGG